MRAPSRSFHVLRTSGEGAQPRMPGWMRPANLTPGMWREEQLMPSKSQMALALRGSQQVILVRRCFLGIAGTHGFGYSSSKKPPPFSLEKTPVKPQGLSSSGCTS